MAGLLSVAPMAAAIVLFVTACLPAIFLLAWMVTDWMDRHLEGH